MLSRTLAIAERCHLKLEKIADPFPEFQVPPGYTLDSYFEHVTREGFARRQEALRPQAEAGRLKHALGDYEQRLARELAIIQQMKFQRLLPRRLGFHPLGQGAGHPGGPGARLGRRLASSPTLLGITDLDPLSFELLFERFLNPERVSPPDFDIDFCMRRRGEVIDYVRRKYGHDCVAKIITFGTLGAKTVIRDVGARARTCPTPKPTASPR